MPAASIAIVRDGRLAWRRAFGVKDTGTNEPVDGDSVFAACSNTKPVFAYGVMKLVERGLDMPLSRYTKRRITTDRETVLRSVIGQCQSLVTNHQSLILVPLRSRISTPSRLERHSSVA